MHPPQNRVNRIHQLSHGSNSTWKSNVMHWVFFLHYRSRLDDDDACFHLPKKQKPWDWTFDSSNQNSNNCKLWSRTITNSPHLWSSFWVNDPQIPTATWRNLNAPPHHSPRDFFHDPPLPAIPWTSQPCHRNTRPCTSPDAIKLHCLVTATSTTGTIGTARLSKACSVKPGTKGKRCDFPRWNGFFGAKVEVGCCW